MHFISLQENLKKGLSIVGHITTKNINLPILNNILIKTREGNIELVSTNLEIGVTHQLRGKIEKEGEFTVDSKLITEYVSLLNGEEKVMVKEVGGELVVEAGDYKTKIKGESAKEFPLIPVMAKKNYYKCPLVEFRKALNSVVFAVSTSENRVELTGVLFSFSNKKLSLAATDSYRLAEKEIGVKYFSEDSSDEPISNEEIKLIVPAKTTQEFLRILNNWDGIELSDDIGVNIYISENQILFTIDSVELISRLISGQYPDYKQIIPTQSQTKVLVDRQELIRATKAAALFSKTGINDITLKFIKNKILISSYSGSSGESKIEISSESEGEDNEITINYRYLLDGLSNIDGSRVKIGLVNPNTPCLLQSEKEDNYLYIVMPIRQ